MNKFLLCAATALLLQAVKAPADTIPTTRVGGGNVGGGGPYFQANEPFLDVYGTVRDNWHLGVGVGANYFFTSWFGAGVETRFEEVDWPNQVSASLFFRYPIEQWRLAPYLYGGGGRQFRDGTQWLGHIGGGVDYRLTSCLGIFGDIRETFPGNSNDFTLWRFGVRLRF
jgi:opacity protein-like surface antigen